MTPLPGLRRAPAVLVVLAGLAAATTPGAGLAAGRILEVGPDRALKAPSDAAAVARRGDTIRIDAGSYADCAVWITPGLTIEGAGGYAHVRDVACDGKAIWVFYRAPVRVRHVRFSGARVPRRNGAGIRWEGNGALTVDDGWFHDNQMGILTHNRAVSSLAVTRSRFERNGDCETFCGHAVYAGRIASATVRDSVFLDHRFGHHIKSRALVSVIVGNRIGDGLAGTSSYAINLPESGTALIRLNTIQKGPRSDNVLCAICIGEEIAVEGEPGKGLYPAHPSRGIRIERNSFRNETGSAETAFVWNRGPHAVSLSGNEISGPGDEYFKGPRPDSEKPPPTGPRTAPPGSRPPGRR